MRFRECTLLAAISILFAVPVQAVDTFSIILTKTVGTGAGCATTDNITVDAGTLVNYCYQVQNTGWTTLNSHTLVDSELGTLVGPNQIQDLDPGQVRTEIVPAGPINVTVTNTATWTAMTSAIYGYGSSSPANMATAMDSATVNVLEMGDGACDDGLDNDDDNIIDCADPDCAGTAVCRAQAPVVSSTGLLVVAVLLLVIGNLALVARRRRV